MILLKPISMKNVGAFKAVRLAALQDSPSAFASTYAKEAALSHEDWEWRVTQWHGDRSACYLAWDGDHPCGMAAGVPDKADDAQACLMAMWVAPSHRSRGVGRLLVEAIIDWARTRQIHTLRLDVTSNNEVARRFYERLGFRPTGKVEPYPNDPALVEVEMSRSTGS